MYHRLSKHLEEQQQQQPQPQPQPQPQKQPATNNQQPQQQQQQQQQQHDFGIFTRFHGYLEGLSTYMIFNYFNQIHPKHTGQLEMIEQNRM